MIRTCAWLERSFGAREVCLPKLREMPKGHILSLEVLKLCFSQCHKVYVLLYFSLLTYLMRRMRDLVPRLEWKGRRESMALQLGCSVVSDSLQPHELQHARLPCPSPTPRACSNSCPSSQWWSHPTMSSSVVPFSSCLQSFPASGSIPRSQFFTSGGQSIGISASASVLSMNLQDWFPLGLTGWISLQSKGLSRVFSSTTVQKHQFFGAQLSLWSNSHIHTQLLEKP